MNTTDREASGWLVLVTLALFVGTIALWADILGIVQW